MKAFVFDQLLKQLQVYSSTTYFHSLAVGEMVEQVLAVIEVDHPEEVITGAYLHDVGKMFIPTAILHKAGPLTPEEWQVMKTHAQKGYEILKKEGFSEITCRAALSHHEKIDGTGYFRSINIPLPIQIVSICDAFSAMTEDRIYRKGIDPEQVWDILLSDQSFSQGLVSTIKNLMLKEEVCAICS